MKIIFFSSDNNISSGAFRAEINLIKDLNKKGHDITLILPYHGSGTKLVKSSNIKYKVIFNIFWICFNPKTLFDFCFYHCTRPINYFATKTIKKLLDNEKFDLAVYNTTWNGLAANVCIEKGIPFVWHLREILEAENRRFYNVEKCVDTMLHAYKLLPVSQKVNDYYLRLFPQEKMIVAYDGTDREIFYNPNKTLFKDEITHIVMIGRVNKQKGQYIGLTALNNLKGYNFDVTIVGYCGASYKNKLLNIAKDIKDRVNFAGVSNNVHEYYKNADIFLMNSIGEAFGLVTVEAMMEGLLVISSKCDGGLEIISTEDNGLFYKPGDPDDLQDKIVYALTHKDKMKEIALNGQKRAIETFYKEKNMRQIEKIYEDAIKKD